MGIAKAAARTNIAIATAEKYDVEESSVDSFGAALAVEATLD